MLDRLKSLPLTIFLTVLIWMYAESQSGTAHIENVPMDNIPVKVSGSASTLAKYRVLLQSTTVSALLSGPQDQVESIRDKSADDRGIVAYIDVHDDDTPATDFNDRILRFATPPGTTVEKPPQLGFRLEPK